MADEPVNSPEDQEPEAPAAETKPKAAPKKKVAKKEAPAAETETSEAPLEAVAEVAAAIPDATLAMDCSQMPISKNRFGYLSRNASIFMDSVRSAHIPTTFGFSSAARTRPSLKPSRADFNSTSLSYNFGLSNIKNF
jgi:hypothetical protein